MTYQGYQSAGLWAATEYLLDSRPYPDLLPETPARRAAIRTMTERVLRKPHVLHNLWPLYCDPAGRFKLPGQRATLLDIAVAAYCNTTIEVEYPWVRRIAELVRDRIRIEIDEDIDLLSSVGYDQGY